MNAIDEPFRDFLLLFPYSFLIQFVECALQRGTEYIYTCIINIIVIIIAKGRSTFCDKQTNTSLLLASFTRETHRKFSTISIELYVHIKTHHFAPSNSIPSMIAIPLALASLELKICSY